MQVKLAYEYCLAGHVISWSQKTRSSSIADSMAVKSLSTASALDRLRSMESLDSEPSVGWRLANMRSSRLLVERAFQPRRGLSSSSSRAKTSLFGVPRSVQAAQLIIEPLLTFLSLPTFAFSRERRVWQVDHRQANEDHPPTWLHTRRTPPLSSNSHEEPRGFSSSNRLSHEKIPNRTSQSPKSRIL